MNDGSMRGWTAEGARLARVAWATRVVPDFFPPRAAALLGVLALHGLDVRTLHALHAGQHPARIAISDAWRTLTYAAADDEINRLANALRVRLALAPGDAVVLALENRAEYLVAWFALMRLGARAVHAGHRVTEDELAWLVRRAEARAVVASEGAIEAARRVVAGVMPRVAVVCVAPVEARAGELSYEALVASGDRAFPPRASRSASESVVFTSGTTGRPKGAVRDFAAFGPRELARILERLPLRFGDRHLVVAPLHHSAPQVMALIHTAIGATIFLASRFDAASALRVLSQRRIHSAFLVPTMLRRILDLPASEHAEAPCPELRALLLGAGEATEDLRRAAIARFGARRVFELYGATELGWVTLVRGDEMLAHPGSVGRPLAGEDVRILDEDGGDVAPGGIGLVYVRNEQTMLGYVHDDDATRRTRRGEWSTVEDLGRVDAAGYLYLEGRARDMVKSGGVNVYPAEVERVLAADPEIREVAVIGVPDREWGERVVAVVVPRDAAFDAARAEARARERLAPYALPRRWEVVAAIPRNANGKVLKNELRARFAPQGEKGRAEGNGSGSIGVGSRVT